MQLAQYRIVRRIGAGGMAEVFLAQSTGAAGFSRNVAIKTIIAAGAAQESIGLFLDEARVAATLQHANIIQTLDLGFENDTLFIAMEYVPGPPLSRLIKELKERGRTLPPHLIAYVGAKVANALDFAHRRVTTAQGQPLALVHRDISPQNILVSRTGVIKLMDFGVARASIQMHKTKTGQVRGKAAYMAPEQVRAQKLDGRTDMFALGLVLYEMATAFRPFQRKNEIASMRAIIGEDVPPITDRNPNVPEALASAIHKCLRRAPEDRWQHCAELEEQLLKTIKSHRSSALEEELVALLEELFGKEQFAEDQMPDVEAWQPTRATMDTPVTPRFKVPGSGLSPTIAAMLGQTQEGPVATSSEPSAPLDEALPRGFTQAPQRPPPGQSFTQPAALGSPDLFGHTPGSSGGLQLTPNGQIPGMLTGTAPVLSPYSLSSVPAMTPGSAAGITTTTGSNARLVLAVLVSFLAGIGLMLFLRNTEEPDPSKESANHPRPAIVPGAQSAPASPSPTPMVSSTPTPTPSSTPRSTPSAPRTPRPSTASPSSPTPLPSGGPPASEAPRPAIDKQALSATALKLKSKAEAAGNSALAGRLTAIAVDLATGKDPSPADLALIYSAERELH